MTASDAVAVALDRLAACDDPAIVLAQVDARWLAEQAAEVDRQQAAQVPLRGMTFAIKDNIDLAGVPTTAACAAIRYEPKRSATVVELLIAAGALPVAKVNLDQFATGLVGTRSPFGTPRNPLHAELVPGGSSSGSGVAVARGLVTFALGTDTAGSGRVPAAMCGIVGYKPTPGRLSLSGVIPAVRSIDCVSVFAADLATAASVVRAGEGFDVNDSYSRRRSQVLARPVRRLGVLADDRLRSHGVDPLIREGYAAALGAASAAGFELLETDPTELFAIGDLLYGGPWVGERVITLDAFDPPISSLDPTVGGILAAARRFTASDVHLARYRLQALRHGVDALFDKVDALALPTIGRHVSLADVEADPIGANSLLGRFTTFTNLADMAAISLPLTSAVAGEMPPFHLSLHGPAWSDEALESAALRLIGAERQGETSLATPPGAVLLAVAGAHLRGQPLDYQLVDRGADFVATATTAPTYRLYAIADTTPPKPALVRMTDGTGAAIEVDVWALSRAALGDFLGCIPAPLGLGTVDLAEGQQVIGFIAEPSALDGATEITEFGGWRAYRSSITGHDPSTISAG